MATRKPDARTFGQDLMRGEHNVGATAPRRGPDATPGGAGGPNSAHRLFSERQAATQAARTSLPAGVTFGEMENFDGAGRTITGTSIFDPVLCELIYRWFCPPAGRVLDPFAGGSVRGIVAAVLGRQYVGVDLSERQLVANRAQAGAICKPEFMPRWDSADSRVRLAIGPGGMFPSGPPAAEDKFDLVFSCPPYADLEVYSDDPRDISAMEYPAFCDAYFDIIAKACALLKPNRFACFVVGDARDRNGLYYGLPADTVAAFEEAGLRLYNDAILVTAVGSLPVRTRRQFEAARKLGKTHQNVLVFVKGDPRKATEAVGPVEFGDISPEDAGVGDAAPEPVVTSVLPSINRSEKGSEAEFTPIESHGGFLVKRDDLFEAGGVRGGKVRTCWGLAQGAVGLVTAGSRSSPQVNIVAHIAHALGVPCRVHVPSGELGPEVEAARMAGAEVVQHKAGHNSVIIARAREDAAERGWTEIPFGMECQAAVDATAAQVANFESLGPVKRIIVPVGSGMSLAGILWGLASAAITVPVEGIVVGADPTKRLNKWAPPDWEDRAKLFICKLDYSTPAPSKMLGDLVLDPIYEAKCLPYLEPDDLLWVVGIRQTWQTAGK